MIIEGASRTTVGGGGGRGGGDARFPNFYGALGVR